MQTKIKQPRFMIEFLTSLVGFVISIWWIIDADSRSEKIIIGFLTLATLHNIYTTAKQASYIKGFSRSIERGLSFGFGIALVMLGINGLMTNQFSQLWSWVFLLIGFVSLFFAWKQPEPQPVRALEHGETSFFTLNDWAHVEPNKLKRYTAILLLINLGLGTLAWFVFGNILAPFILGIGGLLVCVASILLYREQRKAKLFTMTVPLLALLAVFFTITILFLGLGSLLMNWSLS